jgi:hypothetical protein
MKELLDIHLRLAPQVSGRIAKGRQVCLSTLGLQGAALNFREMESRVALELAEGMRSATPPG